MIRSTEKQSTETGKRILAMIVLLMILTAFLPGHSSYGETLDETEEEDLYFDLSDDDWGDGLVILDDPEFFMDPETDEDYAYDRVYEEEESFPVITSVGRSNVKVNGVKSKGRLVKYTIPEQLLRDDPDFLALMTEAEKYIGYPFVYGAASPDIGFDCSGYVCWVFTHSGVCSIRRVGANGLYAMCTDVAPEDLRPGDLVFFEKTMGSSVKGITHVGIYVGNHMMIHAGDPVGFADLRDAEWAKKIYNYGRLPVD